MYVICIFVVIIHNVMLKMEPDWSIDTNKTSISWKL